MPIAPATYSTNDKRRDSHARENAPATPTMSPSASRCLTYLFLLVPPLVVSFYLLASFPPPPGPLPVPSYPGLGSLPPDSRARQIYSEDWVEGGEGAYVDLPMGRVRAVLHPSHGPMLSGVTDAVLARGARERQEGKFIDNTRSSILSERTLIATDADCPRSRPLDPRARLGPARPATRCGGVPRPAV